MHSEIMTRDNKVKVKRFRCFATNYTFEKQFYVSNARRRKNQTVAVRNGFFENCRKEFKVFGVEILMSKLQANTFKLGFEYFNLFPELFKRNRKLKSKVSRKIHIMRLKL